MSIRIKQLLGAGFIASTVLGTSWFAFLAGHGVSWKLAEAGQMLVAAASAVAVYLSCRAAMPHFPRHAAMW